jgi:molecular chaperone GrpE
MKKNKEKKEDDLREEDEELLDEETGQSESLLDEKLKQKENELKEVSGQLIRLQADFVNFRKRSEKEKKDTVSYALEEFICTLLPILDNFQIAMDVKEKMEDPFYKGIEIIYKQLQSSLESNGIKVIESLGTEFDPNIHHAVFMEESEDYESGKVIEVLQTGYMLKDKVIRPAMVKVAK